ncbi:MAG: alpha/beta hydrolase [Acidobacteria bacterium]|nr:alpha/beta hydrolase [Acidobacteriota bacterium]
MSRATVKVGGPRPAGFGRRKTFSLRGTSPNVLHGFISGAQTRRARSRAPLRDDFGSHFHVDRTASGLLPSAKVREDVWLALADGTRLHGWFVRAERQPAAATIIYLHGNGGNLSHLDWLGRSLAGKGFDVLLLGYRGYGRSEGAATDERGLYEDSDAAYDYVSKARGVPQEKIVLYGQSLGTAAAVDVAARRPCGALILESGLSSASDMAAAIIPWLPRFTHRLLRNRLDSMGKLPHVRCPVLVAHGDRDEVIPVEQGHRLFAAAPEPKRLVIVRGAGHNNLSIIGSEPYLKDVAGFINESVRAGF